MMKTIRKFAILISAAIVMLIADMAPQPLWFPFDLQLIPEAHAVAGRQRRTRRRGVAVGYEAGKASAAQSSSGSASDQQATTDPSQATTAQQQPATAQPAPAAAPAPAPAPAPAAGPLPLGTVVAALPAGCTTKTVDGVEYYHDGTNYYRAAFQGNELVYVTAQP